jgi:hypothetical protein
MRRTIIATFVIMLVSGLFLSGCADKVAPTSALRSTTDGHGKGGTDDGWGDHTGEARQIEVKVDYLDTFFWTEEGLAGYYIGMPMKVRVTLTNVGEKVFNTINMRTTFEYSKTGCQERWWYPDPVTGDTTVCVTDGQPLPGDSQWVDFNIYLDPGDSASFEHTYTIPMETVAGNAWVHVELQHSNEGMEFHDAKFYDNPRQSLFDPPPAPAY